MVNLLNRLKMAVPFSQYLPFTGAQCTPLNWMRFDCKLGCGNMQLLEDSRWGFFCQREFLFLFTFAEHTILHAVLCGVLNYIVHGDMPKCVRVEQTNRIENSVYLWSTTRHLLFTTFRIPMSIWQMAIVVHTSNTWLYDLFAKAMRSV